MKHQDIPVANVNDLSNGKMTQISLDQGDILLAHIDHQFYAMGSHCTHYGAPLEKGIIKGKRVVCPWHNACFEVSSGNLLEPPALDNLPSFPVRVEGEKIIVTLPDTIPERCTPKMVSYDPKIDERTFVVLGAGAAGTIAVETLRKEGFQGQIIFVNAETRLPYDRTALSKKYLQGKVSENDLPLRSCEFYQEQDIELYFGRKAVKVDPDTQLIHFEDGDTLKFDKLLVATGSKARSLNLPGSDLDNIYTLRQFDDVQAILAQLESYQRVVMVGSSFISMEVAGSLRKQGITVTVVSPDSVPFEKILGSEIGKRLQQIHKEQGVDFYLNETVTGFEGNNTVEMVRLKSGIHLTTDAVIVGIGVEPATEFLTGIERNSQDNSIIVNQYLQANENIYIAGDIACFPYHATGELTRIEHWRLAVQQGRIAAINMNGKSIPFTSIPFFWTEIYGQYLRYAGHAKEWDEILFYGELEQEFLAFYLKDDQVLAVVDYLCDQEMAAITELMRLQQMPTGSEIKAKKINWLDYLAKV